MRGSPAASGLGGWWCPQEVAWRRTAFSWRAGAITHACALLWEKESEKGRKEGEGAHFFLLSSPMSLPLNQAREKALSPLPLSQPPGAAFSLSLPLFPFLYLPVLHLQAVCFGSSPGSTTQSFSSLSHTCTHTVYRLFMSSGVTFFSPPPAPLSIVVSILHTERSSWSFM